MSFDVVIKLKHWFTDILLSWRKVPESDDQSVASNKTVGVRESGGVELEVRGRCSK